MAQSNTARNIYEKIEST